MTCRLQWCVEMETICRIPIWRTFGRMQWHVIPQPRVTLQGAATWWIHCHDSREFHPAYWKSFFANFIFLKFLMQFRLWWAAAFVSSPIHLLLCSVQGHYCDAHHIIHHTGCTWERLLATVLTEWCRQLVFHNPLMSSISQHSFWSHLTFHISQLNLQLNVAR